MGGNGSDEGLLRIIGDMRVCEAEFCRGRSGMGLIGDYDVGNWMKDEMLNNKLSRMKFDNDGMYKGSNTSGFGGNFKTG
jgi:hypothetical protein